MKTKYAVVKLFHTSLFSSKQSTSAAPDPMAQRLNAQAAPTLSISKICDAQREFDSSVRALNDFYVRKKRAKNGSTGILLTPTRALHEKGLVSSPYLQIAANCARCVTKVSADCRLHCNGSNSTASTCALQRLCPAPPLCRRA